MSDSHVEYMKELYQETKCPILKMAITDKETYALLMSNAINEEEVKLFKDIWGKTHTLRKHELIKGGTYDDE